MTRKYKRDTEFISKRQIESQSFVICMENQAKVQNKIYVKQPPRGHKVLSLCSYVGTVRYISASYVADLKRVDKSSPQRSSAPIEDLGVLYMLEIYQYM